MANETKEKLIRQDEVLKRLGISKSCLYNYVQRKILKPPVPLGPRIKAFREVEIDEFIQSCISSRTDEVDSIATYGDSMVQSGKDFCRLGSSNRSRAQRNPKTGHVVELGHQHSATSERSTVTGTGIIVEESGSTEACLCTPLMVCPARGILGPQNKAVLEEFLIDSGLGKLLEEMNNNDFGQLIRRNGTVKLVTYLGNSAGAPEVAK